MDRETRNRVQDKMCPSTSSIKKSLVKIEKLLRVYVGKTENHHREERGRVCFRVTFRGLPRKLREINEIVASDEMIRGSTDSFCEKRISAGRIEAAYDKHSIFEVG